VFTTGMISMRALCLVPAGSPLGQSSTNQRIREPTFVCDGRSLTCICEHNSACRNYYRNFRLQTNLWCVFDLCGRPK